MKLIGKGTFGKVFQVRKRDTKRIYAMKMLSKKDIVAKKEIAHTIGERKILQRSLECPFLVGLKFSFQTEEYLFFITDYKSGGELFWHLQKEGRFSETRARFYVAELVLALEHLHKFDIVYRDLKPENILLDATGHVALCDFGLSKPDLGAGQLTNTFCGTTEYLAPEVLLDDHGYSKLVDFWSLGVLLFEMCCGWSPFYSEDVQQMYKNICFGKIRFPRGVIGEDGKQFVKGVSPGGLVGIHRADVPSCSSSTVTRNTVSAPNATPPNSRNTPSSSRSTGTCSPTSKSRRPSSPSSSPTRASPTLTRFSRLPISGTFHSNGAMKPPARPRRPRGDHTRTMGPAVASLRPTRRHRPVLDPWRSNPRGRRLRPSVAAH